MKTEADGLLAPNRMRSFLQVQLWIDSRDDWQVHLRLHPSKIQVANHFESGSSKSTCYMEVEVLGGHLGGVQGTIQSRQWDECCLSFGYFVEQSRLRGTKK